MHFGRRFLPLVFLAIPMLPLFSASARTAEVNLPVPVMTIYPGEVIEDAALAERSFRSSFRGRFAMIDAREAVVGKVARRTLLPGQPIPAAAVDEPELVKNGAPVQLVFQEGGLIIVAQATSLQSGGAGDLIRVRNVESGLILSGTVQADGTVRVGNL